MHPRLAAATAVLALMLGAAQPVLADDAGNQIEQARAAYAKGDALRTLTALQAAAASVYGRLADQLTKVMPPALAGWDAAPAESQALDAIGGGLTVTRGYTKGDATLNASLVIDNPAVAASAGQFHIPATQPLKAGWSRVKIGNDDALLRFDASSRSGEILILLADRALLQIEANDIAKEDALVDTAKGWNVGAIRKLLGT